MSKNYLGSIVKDCSRCESVKEVMERYCFEDLNDIFASLRQAKLKYYASAKQCIYAAENIQNIITTEKKDLAERVEKEVLRYKESLGEEEKPEPLKTNIQLAIEYTAVIYGKGRKPISKTAITEILNEYIPKKILKYRKKEVLDDNYIVTLLSVDKSAAGKKGSEFTKGITKNVDKDEAREKGRNGARIRWQNYRRKNGNK